MASAVGGILEIVEHRSSGFLVEPDNPTELAREGYFTTMN
jgi:glycosyltransferase involved in cell wall biosynthesis